MIELDQEEQEILEAYEAGRLKRSNGADQIQKRHKAYAEAMFRKDAGQEREAN